MLNYKEMCYFVSSQKAERFMKKFFATLCIAIALSSCDDGDVIVTSFNFEDASLQSCTGANSIVFFKINTNSLESISLRLSVQDDLFATQGSFDFQINGGTNVVNYRTYDGAPTDAYFCSAIPPTSPTVLQDFVGNDGTATLLIDLLRDDNDGVDEDIDSDLDTDNDGLLNFYDFDDDGDNIPTAFEIGDDPDNPLDSDGDGDFDYLDEDDDNDGVLTRDEDTNMNLDPRDDITDPTVGADYLNPAVSVETIIKEYIEHSYTTVSDVEVFLSNVVLSNGTEQLNQESLDLGGISNVDSGTVTITPPFK